MEDIQIRALHRHVAFIEGLGCQFKIIAPNGEEFGSLAVVPPKPKRKFAYKRGTLIDYFKPQINFDAAVAEAQTIVCGRYEPEQIRRGVCRALTKAWGKDSYDTALEDNKVKVVRLY
jgi:hypothetical protein